VLQFVRVGMLDALSPQYVPDLVQELGSLLSEVLRVLNGLPGGTAVTVQVAISIGNGSG
jgi:hypothetical protein